jgi:[FeFe] hydrogenase H-cluster maturation GTPase HydF
MSRSKTRTIRGDRLHIGFFGKRNAGKSSLINSVTGQPVAITAKSPGTTTDPVFKAMELASLGPVVLIDTAGLDDEDCVLGDLRKKRTWKVLKKTDLALVIVDGSASDFALEDSLIAFCQEEQIPYLIVLNKIDIQLNGDALQWIKNKEVVRVSAENKTGINELKQSIIDIAPKQWEPPFIRDLIRPGEVVVLVVPIDLAAPKGRLIMPQVKALRDILDADGIPVMCKERELITTLQGLKNKPALVVTDSQVFPQVAADVPMDVLLTSFSILSARQKGNLGEMVKSVLTVKKLKPGDRVLIAEACTHHPREDDIGRVKIPRWLNNYIGGSLQVDTVAGTDFPDNLNSYKLIVHCGACTLNRKEMLWRQQAAAEHSVPITNYGVLISFLKAVFPRALKPFPELYAMFQDKPSITVHHRIRKKMAALTEI